MKKYVNNAKCRVPKRWNHGIFGAPEAISQIACGNLPPGAALFRRLGPAPTRKFAELVRYTALHFRVLIASGEIQISEKPPPKEWLF